MSSTSTKWHWGKKKVQRRWTKLRLTLELSWQLVLVSQSWELRAEEGYRLRSLQSRAEPLENHFIKKTSTDRSRGREILEVKCQNKCLLEGSFISAGCKNGFHPARQLKSIMQPDPGIQVCHCVTAIFIITSCKKRLLNSWGRCYVYHVHLLTVTC